MPPSKRDPGADAPLAAAPPPRDARRIAEALSDPTRADVFDALTAWLGTATAEQIGRFLRVPADEVARHLRVLEERDLVEPISDPAAGDGPYRATREALITDEDWAEFPSALRRRLVARMLEKMEERVRAALPRGGFDAADVHVSWMPADLDGIGYHDMVRLLAETLHRAGDIQAAVVERRAAGTADDEEVRSEVMLLHFRPEAEDAEAAAHPAVAPSVLDRIYALADSIAHQLPSEEPDWQRVADDAAALAALARRRAMTSPVR